LLRRICEAPDGAEKSIAPRRNSGKRRRLRRFSLFTPRQWIAAPLLKGSNRLPIPKVAASLVSNCKQGENAPMSIESHLSELARKHEALEREIEAERTHPGGDSLRLAELKRRKLSLKDEIAKLQEETVH
jgi:hypothetical protein